MKLEEQLIRDEGMVLHAYQDHLGYWTIGVGRLIDQRKGGAITKDEALHLLRNDIIRVMAEVHKALPWVENLDEVRCDALINMAFNMGIKNLLGFKNTLAALKRKDYEETAIGIMDSLYAHQVPARAERIAKQMLTGIMQ